jgi:hypothetical protein
MTPIGEPDGGTEEEFGIPRENAFLRAIVTKVKAVIGADPEVKIEEVIHGQYRESYFFVKDESRCRIDINYNGKGKLTSLLAPCISEFSTRILELLSPLKGILITVPTGDSSSERILSKDFLRQFDSKLEVLVTDLGARVDSVHEQAWSLRYCFTRSEERAVVDVYYNGREQLTKFATVWPLSTSRTLVSEIESVLAKGFD